MTNGHSTKGSVLALNKEQTSHTYDESTQQSTRICKLSVLDSQTKGHTGPYHLAILPAVLHHASVSPACYCRTLRRTHVLKATEVPRRRGPLKEQWSEHLPVGTQNKFWVINSFWSVNSYRCTCRSLRSLHQEARKHVLICLRINVCIYDAMIYCQDSQGMDTPLTPAGPGGP